MIRLKHTAICAATGISVALTMSSCVHDELFDTPHPTHGAVEITADYSGKSGEADEPESYFHRIGEEWQQVSGYTNAFHKLLAPGDHQLMVYNEPQGMSVSGTNAVVNTLQNGEIEPHPGYLHAYSCGIQICADDTLHVTAPMSQLTRRLNIILTASEGDYNRVSYATARLSGVTRSVDLLTFERTGETAAASSALAADGNRFSLYFRLLGITPTQNQILTVDITFSNGDTQRIESDLTRQLSSFNNGITPLTLTGNLMLPVEGNATGTIDGWSQTDGGNVDAH